MMKMINLVLFFIAVFTNSTLAYTHHNFNFSDVELTTLVKAKEVDCFYQYAKPKQTLRFEYRVVNSDYSVFSGTSDLLITFYVVAPNQKVVVKEIKKSNGIFKHSVKIPGDFQICLDNSFSHSSAKTVFFEMSLDISNDESRWEVLHEMIEADKKGNDTISMLRRAADKLKDDLESLKHYQDTFRAVEARDLNIMEKNLVKVNALSSLTIVCMMLIGAFHLFVLKSMFRPSSFLYKLIRKVC
ncbi:transmembrane emp24 domain-containing protein 1-like [Uloborus diversus]|uniref:transmembrane emp24 domain-containing protein 1-like n=1 Tax=Uloborus diversus TaxID=327109 RepID=UPI00240A7F8A|nr:transmembrane emp24 domain-containing protein 1-like [Uloborus diversus]